MSDKFSVDDIIKEYSSKSHKMTEEEPVNNSAHVNEENGSANDISDTDRALIVEAFTAFSEGIFGNKTGVYCESKIFNTDEFGYNKIVVERPQRDEHGEIIKKKGKPVADSSLRDTENVPLTEDIDSYFEREVLPYAPDAWIDRSKTKIGYEIPMTRYFYEYQATENSEVILSRITDMESRISTYLQELFGRG